MACARLVLDGRAQQMTREIAATARIASAIRPDQPPGMTTAAFVGRRMSQFRMRCQKVSSASSPLASRWPACLPIRCPPGGTSACLNASAIASGDMVAVTPADRVPFPSRLSPRRLPGPPEAPELIARQCAGLSGLIEREIQAFPPDPHVGIEQYRHAGADRPGAGGGDDAADSPDGHAEGRRSRGGGRGPRVEHRREAATAAGQAAHDAERQLQDAADEGDDNPCQQGDAEYPPPASAYELPRAAQRIDRSDPFEDDRWQSEGQPDRDPDRQDHGRQAADNSDYDRSEEHTSELQSL